MSIADYIQKLKHIAESLASISCPIDDEDLIIYTLNGLPAEYGSFKTVIRTYANPITIEELHVLLICEEMNLESEHQSITGSDFSSTALVAFKSHTTKPACFNNSNRGRGYQGRGRG